MSVRYSLARAFIAATSLRRARRRALQNACSKVNRGLGVFYCIFFCPNFLQRRRSGAAARRPERLLPEVNRGFAVQFDPRPAERLVCKRIGFLVRDLAGLSVVKHNSYS